METKNRGYGKERKYMKILTIIGCMMFFSATAYAAFDYEADAMYKASQTYMRSYDIKNALRSAYLARELYDNNKNTGGIIKCDKMIAEINSTVMQSQMADYFYDIAGDYYILARNSYCDVTNLDRATIMSNNAKKVYSSIGGAAGSQGVLKSDDLMKTAAAEKMKCEREKYTEAENLFNVAKSNFFMQEYLAARAYAVNASTIYSEIPDPAGMAKTATLLAELDKKINEIKINAAASYDKALKLYASRRLDESLEYAASAQRLYNIVQDEEGYRQATNLLSRINSEIVEDRDKLLRDARTYITDAESFYTIGDHVNATDSAKKAKDIYQSFYDKAAEEEKGLQDTSKVKTILYRGYLREVNRLLKEIQDAWGTVRMTETAGLYYKKSQEEYVMNRLNEALAFANNARSLFSDMKDYVGISKTDTLLDQIKTRMQLRTQAEIFMKSAREFQSIAEFDTAYSEASKAKAIYVDMLDQNKTAEVQAMMSQMQKGSEDKEKANEYYRKAETYYDVLDYEKAFEWSKKANDIFVQINYSIGMQESQTIMTESDEYIMEEEAKVRNLAIGASVIVLIIGAILFQHSSKQRKIDEELKQRRKMMDERKKRMEEEGALKVETETKTRVEDELRKLIEAERKTAMDDDTGREGKNA